MVIILSPSVRLQSGIWGDLNQQLNYHETDEVYILFSRSGESIWINMFSSNKDKVTVESPVAIYHPKGEPHKYDYIGGQGFVLVVLKEKHLGEGYKFIPA